MLPARDGVWFLAFRLSILPNILWWSVSLWQTAEEGTKVPSSIGSSQTNNSEVCSRASGNLVFYGNAAFTRGAALRQSIGPPPPWTPWRGPFFGEKRPWKKIRKSGKRGFPGDPEIGPKSIDLCKKIKLGGLPAGCQKGTSKKSLF